ncbi:MAG TPA: glycosyltransferase [Pyrinomonadaceae bacterium]|nr:glycosyltransferase [Pyrinomonadaceae bacterium]
MRTLYICYFGLREPLVQTQVLPYLRQLVGDGVGVHLLTFEPRLSEWPPEERGREREALAAQGIRWHALAYHKRPSLPATLYDILAGGRLATRLARRHGIDFVHARNHVPAAMGLIAKRRAGARLIFDIRGFMPEEYADAGVWPAGGYLFRLTKAAERRLLDAADAFVMLTERARGILFPGRAGEDARGRPLEVIPCCVDVERFASAAGVSREEARRELGVEGRNVFVYVGALGGWYLTDEMADFLALAHRRDPSAFTVVLTQSQPEMIADRLRARGVADADYLVRKVSPGSVPRYLKAADVALSFIKPCYSKLASSPTKVAEYLISGLPVVSNSGIGDVDEVIAADRVGSLVREFDEPSYLRALAEVDELRREPGLAERCRESARRRFDLERVGGARYRRLYRRLGGSQPSQAAAPGGRKPRPA